MASRRRAPPPPPWCWWWRERCSASSWSRGVPFVARRTQDVGPEERHHGLAAVGAGFGGQAEVDADRRRLEVAVEGFGGVPDPDLAPAVPALPVVWFVTAARDLDVAVTDADGHRGL